MRPRRYEIRLHGTVAPDVLDELGALHASVEPAHTVLRGALPDQAALHGVLDRLQALGLDVIEVHRVPDEPAGPAGAG